VCFFCPHRYPKLSNLFEVFKTALQFIQNPLLTLNCFLFDDNTQIKKISTEIFINLYYVANHTRLLRPHTRLRLDFTKNYNNLYQMTQNDTKPNSLSLSPNSESGKTWPNEETEEKICIIASCIIIKSFALPFTPCHFILFCS
jgi:hypothetical protein